MHKKIHIIVVEASSLLKEGLAGMLHKSGLNCEVIYVELFDDLDLSLGKNQSDFIIINPGLIQNKLKAFNNYRTQYNGTKWLGLVYAYHDPVLLSQFDALIALSDTPYSMAKTMNQLLAAEPKAEQENSQDVLSEREIDVLKLVAAGMANKEIADKLNISTNTVITHRKNISQKTGIKSVAGLTLYAVVQKLISTETLPE